MKKNLTIVGLNPEFKKSIAKKLADELEMYYIDINDFVKYDVIDFNNIIRTVGLEYYKNLETKAVNVVSSYENSLITLNLSTFFENNNYKLLKQNSSLIYIKINFPNFKNGLLEERPNCAKYESLLDEKVFKQRDGILSKICDIVVEIKLEEKNLIEKIIKSIKKYYGDIL